MHNVNCQHENKPESDLSWPAVLCLWSVSLFKETTLLIVPHQNGLACMWFFSWDVQMDSGYLWKLNVTYNGNEWTFLIVSRILPCLRFCILNIRHYLKLLQVTISTRTSWVFWAACRGPCSLQEPANFTPTLWPPPWSISSSWFSQSGEFHKLSISR